MAPSTDACEHDNAIPISQDPDAYDPRAVLWLCPDCGQLEGRVAERYGGGRYVYAMAPRPAGAAQLAPPLPAVVELGAAHTVMFSCPDATLRAEAGPDGVRVVVESVVERVGFVALRATLTHDQADRLVWLLGQRPPADH